jgi:hypothetical protein
MGKEVNHDTVHEYGWNEIWISGAGWSLAQDILAASYMQTAGDWEEGGIYKVCV